MRRIVGNYCTCQQVTRKLLVICGGKRFTRGSFDGVNLPENQLLKPRSEGEAEIPAGANGEYCWHFRSRKMVEELAQKVGAKGGSMVLIKDCVACKGCFMMHYLLKRLLSDTSARVVMLGLAEPFSHYARIARKQGCNLQTMGDKGRFLFVEQPQLLSTQGSGADAGANATPFSDNPLAGLYLKVREAARGKKVPGPSNEGGGQTCIMIDDASILDVIAGGSHNFVLDFLHYCRALKIGKQRCSVILLTHLDVYEEPPASYMILELEHAADTVITVEPLSTGLAVDVHGQLSILHRTDQLEDVYSQVTTRSRFQKHQFRVLEGTIQFFLPGQL